MWRLRPLGVLEPRGQIYEWQLGMVSRYGSGSTRACVRTPVSASSCEMSLNIQASVCLSVKREAAQPSMQDTCQMAM